MKKKYTLSIAAIFNNEAPYLKEWIEYHLLVGVDHFYLYNNGSNDEYIEVLSPYIKKDLVTLIDWPDRQVSQEKSQERYAWVFRTQVPSYEDACLRSSKETTWLALIDLDEFMVPISAKSMKELLKNYDEAPGITLYWHIYGTSGISSLPKNTLLIETLHRVAHPLHSLNKDVVKSIVKPELFSSFSWPPHTCIFKNNHKALFLTKKDAQINHYINRTIQYVLQSKVKKKEHMDNRKLSTTEIQALLNLGNEQEDTEKAIFRFIPDLRQKMGFEQK